VIIRETQNLEYYRDFRALLDVRPGSSQSAQTPLPGRHQAMPDQIQIGQRESREQARRILGQSPVTHFGKAPQTFDDVKSVFAAVKCSKNVNLGKEKCQSNPAANL
jgi:hypothetical protein